MYPKLIAYGSAWYGFLCLSHHHHSCYNGGQGDGRWIIGETAINVYMIWMICGLLELYIYVRGQVSYVYIIYFFQRTQSRASGQSNSISTITWLSPLRHNIASVCSLPLHLDQILLFAKQTNKQTPEAPWKLIWHYWSRARPNVVQSFFSLFFRFTDRFRWNAFALWTYERIIFKLSVFESEPH